MFVVCVSHSCSLAGHLAVKLVVKQAPLLLVLDGVRERFELAANRPAVAGLVRAASRLLRGFLGSPSAESRLRLVVGLYSETAFKVHDLGLRTVRSRSEVIRAL